MLRDGRIFRGADADVHLAGRIWWAWPLYVLAKLPGAMPMMRYGYRWVASHRDCVSGTKQCTSTVVRK